MDKKLMVYYSFEGNMDWAAKTLQSYDPEIVLERLVPEKEPPKKGLAKFFHGGKSALTGELPPLDPMRNVPADFDTLIIGFPVWAGTFPPAVGSFLKQYQFSGKNVYLIGSSAGGGAAKAFKNLESKLTGNHVQDTLSLVNPLNNKESAAEKLKEFSRKLVHRS